MSDLITIIGPTASGKTSFGVALASELDTEIISADSRQIYRKMDLGTGKDLEEYVYKGKQIPHHLLDIRDAGYKYNVYEFQHDFLEAYNDIRSRGKLPVLCGGTGMYVESVLRSYKLVSVPENPELRAQLAPKSLEELEVILRGYKKLHNTTDIDTAKRAIREIEIQEYYSRCNPEETKLPDIDSLVIGVDIDRELRRQKISARLEKRFEEGMLEEVRGLLDSGIAPEDLIYYGLEYKYMTLHLTGQLSWDEMYKQLEIAIHQFAKRQMTWFRGMERRGFRIHWVDAAWPVDRKIEFVKELLAK
ncbi:MAG: tRNA (adenosine(37)-N6)-dimethylallyltransferase MiaA [Bacteroidales bacterium]